MLVIQRKDVPKSQISAVSDTNSPVPSFGIQHAGVRCYVKASSHPIVDDVPTIDDYAKDGGPEAV